MKPICVITGLTATGKSKVAVELAKYWNAEIINADSVSIFKELNIGSAKPSLKEQENIPHHLLDVCSYKEDYSIYQFQQDGRKLIQEIQKRNKNVIVVGGSGLYIKALLYDYQFVEEFKEPLERKESTDVLYKRLEVLDPKEAKNIHPNNRKRIIRALDSYEIHKKPKHKLRDTNKDTLLIPSIVFFLAGERQKIYERIESRVDKMFDNGLYEELKTLYNQDKDLFKYRSLQAIGYKEFEAYFNKNISYETLIEQIKRNTRRFAKRQITWFKHQQPSIEIDVFNENILEKIKKEMHI